MSGAGRDEERRDGGEGGLIAARVPLAAAICYKIAPLTAD